MPVFTSGGSSVTSASIVDGEIVNADVNANAGIAITKISNAPYAVLADVTLGSPATSLASGTFAGKTHLRIIVTCPSIATSDLLCLRFNGDTGANYTYQHSTDVGAITKVAGDTLHRVHSAGTTGTVYAVFDVLNIATVDKRHVGQVIDTNKQIQASGFWSNTSAQITAVSLITSTYNMATGTRLIILGMD